MDTEQAIAQMLWDGNFDLSSAKSGARAFACAKPQRPDLVLLDINLPDMNGIEVARRMKARRSLSTVLIVMITGQSERPAVVQSIRAGAVDLLVKPFDRETLLARIARCLSAPGESGDGQT